MFPNITEFKEKLQDGGSRPSLFHMEITWPTPVALGVSLGSPNIPFHCRISEIPGSTISSIPLKYAGREIKYAGVRSFSPLTITIINDEGFKVRQALEAWIELMQSRESNVSVLVAPLAHGSDGYGGTGRVVQYKKTGEIAKSFVFVDMFPSSVSPIAADWSNDSIAEYTATFEYQHWVPGDEFAGSVARSLVS